MLPPKKQTNKQTKTNKTNKNSKFGQFSVAICCSVFLPCTTEHCGIFCAFSLPYLVKWRGEIVNLVNSRVSRVAPTHFLDFHFNRKTIKLVKKFETPNITSLVKLTKLHEPGYMIKWKSSLWNECGKNWFFQTDFFGGKGPCLCFWGPHYALKRNVVVTISFGPSSPGCKLWRRVHLLPPPLCSPSSPGVCMILRRV